MDKAIEIITTKILTEAGVVAALLAVACWWLAKQWSEERKDHKATTMKMFEMAEKQREGSFATTDALNQLRAVVERAIFERRA